MIETKLSRQSIRYWLYGFIFFHICVWTLAPVWVRQALPMDALEGSIWGHQLEWGYDKNPFLNGWLTHVALLFGGDSGWTTYLFSQLSVGLCFLAVWQLGKKILPPQYACCAVILLAGMQYYNLHAIDFNDNTLELSLWALTCLFFYNALRQGKLADWLLTGLFAGLGMMAKYYTVMLLLPMLMLLIVTPEGRRHWRSWQLYAGLFIFSIVIAPHVYWLFHHQFITVLYALNRVDSQPLWSNHFFFPLQFTWQQLEVFMPCVLLYRLLFWRRNSSPQTFELKEFDRKFLWYLGVGPFFLTVLLSAILGIKLRAGWGQPLLSLWGILLIAYFPRSINQRQFYYFIFGIVSFVLLAVSAYSYALIHSAEASSANFPGRNIARTITQQWHKTYHQPLNYVIGERWLAGNVAFFSADHPAVYIEGNVGLSPWINEKTLQKSGAVIIWAVDDIKAAALVSSLAHFKNISVTHFLQFPRLLNPHLMPINIEYAFIAPTPAADIVKPN